VADDRLGARHLAQGPAAGADAVQAQVVLHWFGECAQTPDHLGIGRRDVGALADVRFQAVKLLPGQMQLPRSAADRLQLQASVIVVQTCLRGPYSYRLEDVAVYLGVAESEDHRALSDSRLVAAVLRAIVRRTRRLHSVADLFRLSPPLTFGDADGQPLDPPPGYEQLALAIEQQLTIEMIYDDGTRGLTRRRITPLALVETAGRAYLTAYCHADQIEKTYRLDRIREFRIQEG
jgi:hypothetical protein